MTGPRGGAAMDRESWAWFMAKITADLGPGSADVVRRFVAGEIEYLEPARWDDGRQR